MEGYVRNDCDPGVTSWRYEYNAGMLPVAMNVKGAVTDNDRRVA